MTIDFCFFSLHSIGVSQCTNSLIVLSFACQVGVQTEIEPDAGANALEDRVNAVMPLANKDDEDEEGKQRS